MYFCIVQKDVFCVSLFFLIDLEKLIYYIAGALKNIKNCVFRVNNINIVKCFNR
jgi:hypothetical protein